MTTKSSERIVVFVTPAQKLAISKTADNLGISVSELVRRAVLNFNATSEQIKVAGIVDRLPAPKAPDPLDVALKSVAPAAKAPDTTDQSDHDDNAADSGEDAWLLTGSGRSLKSSRPSRMLRAPLLPAHAAPLHSLTFVKRSLSPG